MPFVKQRLPAARLVIGYAGVGLESSTQLEKEIIDFSNATGHLTAASRPEFHAWIELAQGDTFDITAAVSMLADKPHRGYIDGAEAVNFDFNYFPVFKNESDVERFYTKLCMTVVPGKRQDGCSSQTTGLTMRGLEKFVSLRFVLLVAFIALGASLHSAGKVGFWGMLFIMMLPNIAFALLRRKKSPAA